MTSTHVHHRLDAYVDDELPPAEALALADHLTSCAECSAAYAVTLATVTTLREELVHYHAPDTLRVRVRAALREAVREDDARPSTSRAMPAAPRAASAWGAPWVRRAAAAVLIAATSSGLMFVALEQRAAGPERDVAEQVLASHIRSLMPDHLTDVRSNDQHNVKPWFNGRLDFSPSVPRLDSLGFPLVGGRLDYVAGHPAAVVVYARRQHIINVFAWPTSEADISLSEPPSLAADHGYHRLRWRAAGVEHWIVSDLNAAELERFANLLRHEAEPSEVR